MMGAQSQLKQGCNSHFWCKFVLLALSVIANIVTVNGAPKCPPGGAYSDKHTGRTECCAGICKNAKITGMEEECSFNCPNYQTSIMDKTGDILKAPLDTGAAAAADSSSATLLYVIVPLISVVLIPVVVVALHVFTKWKLPCLRGTAAAKPSRDVEKKRSRSHHPEDQHEMLEARARLMSDGQADDQPQPQRLEDPGPQMVAEAGRAADVNRENCHQSPALVLPPGRQEAGPQYPEQHPVAPHGEAQPSKYPVCESGEPGGPPLTAFAS